MILFRRKKYEHFLGGMYCFDNRPQKASFLPNLEVFSSVTVIIKGNSFGFLAAQKTTNFKEMYMF